MTLSKDSKADIQSAYRQWLDANNFKPRRSQREMIATVANVIGHVKYDSEVTVYLMVIVISR